MRTSTEPRSRARIQALSLALACTLAGWIGAVAGHHAPSMAMRAILILVVAACAVAVFFTLLALAPHRPSGADDVLRYNWRAIPGGLAIVPMATLFLFGVSPLGVGLALVVALLLALPDPKLIFLEAVARETARDAEQRRPRPMVLDAVASDHDASSGPKA